MLKKNAIFGIIYSGAAALALQTSMPEVSAQATITFANFGSGVDAPVSLAPSGELLHEGWVAQLWAGLSENELTPYGDLTSFAGQGYFVGESVTMDGIEPGKEAWFQVAVWESSESELAEAQAKGLGWGLSNVFKTETGGTSPMVPPPWLHGLEPFSVSIPDSPSDPNDPGGPNDPPDTPVELVQSLSGYAWKDSNADGIRDSNEPFFEGIAVDLLSCESKDILASDVTDSTGYYEFADFSETEVYLAFLIDEDHWVTRFQEGEDPDRNSDLDPLTGRSVCIAFDCSEENEAGCRQSHWDIGLVEKPDETDDPTQPEAPMDPFIGVAGPGFWKNHLSAWPVDEVTLGGETYAKEEAVVLLTNGSDKTKTLFRSLLAAKLNAALGNDDACVAETIALADAWLETNPLNSGVKGGHSSWKDEGRNYNDQLEAYNSGGLCAPAKEPARTPSEMTVGFNNPGQQGGEDGFRVRIKGHAGRSYVLQESPDMETWTDVEEFTNYYGVSEAVLSGLEARPNSFFRIVVAPGPVHIWKPDPEGFGKFKEVGHGETVALEPIVYNGDLIIAGSGNEVSGTTLSENHFTVIAGNLDIRGSNNVASNMTVLGKVVLRGNGNRLESVDYQGGVEEKGNGNNEF